MKKLNLSILLILIFATTAIAQQQYRTPVRPTKNVIVMIPDGTSIGVVSAARWYQIYNKLGGENLAIDHIYVVQLKHFPQMLLLEIRHPLLPHI